MNLDATIAVSQPTAPNAGIVGCEDWLGRIICGDNTEVLSGFPAECVDLVVTSPPYDQLRTYGGHSWDFHFLARQLVRVLKPGGVIVWVVADATVNGSETLTSMRHAIHFKDVCRLNVHDTMIYRVRGTGAKGSSHAYWQAWEYMLVLAKGKPNTVNRLTRPRKETSGPPGSRISANGKQKEICRVEVGDDSIRDNVWEYSVGAATSDDATGHPAVFPESLAKDHIASWSNPGDVVLDPFSGSGTTCKAAKELNRAWCGIDINPEYCAIAEARLCQDVLQLEACSKRPND